MTEDAAEAALMARLGGEPADDNDQDGDEQDHEAADEDDDDDGQSADDAHDDDQSLEGADEDDGDSEQGDDDSETATETAAAIDDAAEVEVTVNGTAQKFTIGSLKRLAGQEAALTQKSQEAETVGGRAAASLQAAFEIAVEDFQPYENVDWLVLQTQMDPADFAWHRDNAGKAEARLQKIVQAAQGFEQAVQDRRTADNTRAAAECLQTMKADVPGWGDVMHAEVKAYGVKEGLTQADMDAVSNPAVLKLLRKAMLFDKGQKVGTKKVADAPTKVLRKGASRQDAGGKALNTQKAMARLARTGSEADAMSALMGRWAD